MKRNFKTTAVLALIVVMCAAFLLCACDDANNLQKTVTIVIGEGDSALTTVETTGAKYLFDVMNELAQKEENPVIMNGSWSTYGLFVTEIGGVKAEGENEYIAILTTDETYWDATDFAVKREIDGKKYVMSVLGISSLPLVDGESYLFVLATF